MLTGVDVMRRMVHDVYLLEYLFESYPYRAPEACYAHARTIRFCLVMVHVPRRSRPKIPSS